MPSNAAAAAPEAPAALSPASALSVLSAISSPSGIPGAGALTGRRTERAAQVSQASLFDALQSVDLGGSQALIQARRLRWGRVESLITVVDLPHARRRYRCGCPMQ